MTLEEVLPFLRKGKCIKRNKTTHVKANLKVSFFYGRLICNYTYKSGKSFVDRKYHFSNEDLLTEDWEVSDYLENSHIFEDTDEETLDCHEFSEEIIYDYTQAKLNGEILDD